MVEFISMPCVPFGGSREERNLLGKSQLHDG